MMRKLRNLGNKLALSALCGALLLGYGQVSAAAYAYKISVAATIPKGYAGEKPSSTQPSNTKFTPCSELKLDAVTFTVTYDAGKLLADKKDVYLILYNPDVINSGSIKQGPFFTITKYPLGNNQVLRSFSNVADMNTQVATPSAINIKANDDIYVKAEDNPGTGAISEPVFGGAIILDGVTSGTWQMVGIIADRGTIDFNDPKKWAAWDVATIVLGKPWAANEIATPNPVTGLADIPVYGACKDIIIP